MLPAPPPLVRLADGFDPIGLGGLGDASLMDRVDSKFVLSAHLVPQLLRRLEDRYRVLEVAGVRASRYRSEYYDTPDRQLYHAHHRGRAPRHKVRVRSYLDAGTRYLEVKRKTNKGRTLKYRAGVEAPPPLDLARLLGAIPGAFGEGLPLSELEPSIRADFHRFTFVHDGVPERLTLDLGLSLSLNGASLEFHSIAIAEVKQERQGASPGRDALRAAGARAGGLSKYCLGVAMLAPHARRNNFKPLLDRLYGLTLPNPTSSGR